MDEKDIRTSWDDLLRLVATIKLKKATASEIFRRLNSYSRQDRLYATMKAFGQIIKSMFILHYIDQVELRQAIEKQLNKIDSRTDTRAVAVGNPRGIEHAEKEDREVSEGCTHLTRNSIICWNCLYLTRQLDAATPPPRRGTNTRGRSHPIRPMQDVISTCLASMIFRTTGCGTTRVFWPQNPHSASSRKIGSCRNGNLPIIPRNANFLLGLLIPLLGQGCTQDHPGDGLAGLLQAPAPNADLQEAGRIPPGGPGAVGVGGSAAI